MPEKPRPSAPYVPGSTAPTPTVRVVTDADAEKMRKAETVSNSRTPWALKKTTDAAEKRGQEDQKEEKSFQMAAEDFPPLNKDGNQKDQVEEPAKPAGPWKREENKLRASDPAAEDSKNGL